jgi:membrane protein required for colicin V production
MQAYDYLMIAVLVGATLFGFVKGMAWQIASLASLVVSYFVALRFSTEVAPVFGDSQPWNRFVAMLVIYMACSFAIWVLFRAVADVIEKVKMKEFDRQLGALFGLAKGVLLCAVITFFAVTLLPPEQKRTIVATRSGHYIGVLLDKTRAAVPPEYSEVVKPYLDKFERRLDPNYLPPEGELLPGWPEESATDLPLDWLESETAERETGGVRLNVEWGADE